MKRYVIQYWEKESVWCRRTIELKTDKDPNKLTPEELKKEIEEDGVIDWIDDDYNWETAEVSDYDFKTDFIAEEVKD